VISQARRLARRPDLKKPQKGKRLGSVWSAGGIWYRGGVRGRVEGWFTPVHARFMKPPSVQYFLSSMVSIGLLESAPKELENGRPSVDG
jgi:hypothetical protein